MPVPKAERRLQIPERHVSDTGERTDLSLPKTAYILLWFPLPSETFIFREVQNARAAGLPFVVHTLYGPAAKNLSPAMMHSLEVRAPFLDRDVAEFICRLPSRYKLRGARRKYLLKKAVAGILPKEILSRGKRGFLIPTAAWLRGRLRPQVDELLGERYLKAQGIFDPKTVTGLVTEHATGAADHRKKLWTLLVLQLWLAQHKPSIIAWASGFSPSSRATRARAFWAASGTPSRPRRFLG